MAKPDANEDLSAYLDGELTDAEIAELEAEFARDAQLRAELESLESVVRWVREQGPDAAPLGFHHRVMARIEAEHPERPSLRRPLGFPLEGWLVALAAAAVLLALIPHRSPTVADPLPMAVGPASTPEVQEKVSGPAGGAVRGEPPLVGAGYSYVVRSTNPEMKLDLLRLAGRYGGAVGIGGAEITDPTMSSNTEALLVNVAQPDLTRFAREVEALGYELVREPSSEIVAGEVIPVRITLQLVGGSPEGLDTKPSAARRDDAIEEPE